jgi:hypothetical protein
MEIKTVQYWRPDIVHIRSPRAQVNRYAYLSEIELAEE